MAAAGPRGAGVGHALYSPSTVPGPHREELRRTGEGAEDVRLGAGEPGLGADVKDDLEERAPAALVQVGGDLVEQQHRRAAALALHQAGMGRDERDQHGLLLPSGALLRRHAAVPVGDEQVAPLRPVYRAALGLRSAACREVLPELILHRERRGGGKRALDQPVRRERDPREGRRIGGQKSLEP